MLQGFINFLEAESMNGYSCSVPLNIILSVDNYTLRNGTERNKVLKWQTQTFLLKKKTTKGQINVQAGNVLSIISLIQQLNIL